MRNVLVCALLLCLAACTQKGWMDRLATPEEQQTAIDTAQAFRDGDVDKIAPLTEPQLKGDLQRASVEIRPVLERAKGPFSIDTINVVRQSGGPTTKTFTLQAGSDSKWALVEIVFRGAPGSLRLAGFHAWPASSDPSKLNDFNIGQRGFLGYVWLLLMFACVALCLTAVALIWRRPWLKRRWLWTLGSLVGFTGFGLNWSTGAWAILFVNVSLLGAGATKAGPLSPWILTFAIPVVAIIVILRFARDRHVQVGAD
jgi:hypothetical protein